MQHLYGTFSNSQISSFKKSIQGSIYFLLLCVDPKTKQDYQNVDVNKSFQGLQWKLGGANILLCEQPQIISVMCLLEAAKDEYNQTDTAFDFQKYRKLILDAGAEIMRLKEVE